LDCLQSPDLRKSLAPLLHRSLKTRDKHLYLGPNQATNETQEFCQKQSYHSRGYFLTCDLCFRSRFVIDLTNLSLAGCGLGLKLLPAHSLPDLN
jgi:hypothetical protein